MTNVTLPDFHLRTLAQDCKKNLQKPTPHTPATPLPLHKSGISPKTMDRSGGGGRRGSVCAVDWIDASKKVMGVSDDGIGASRSEKPKKSSSPNNAAPQKRRTGSVFVKGGKRGGGGLVASAPVELRGIDKVMFEKLCLGNLDVAGAVRQTESQRGPAGGV
jgi:hypothetical protein